MKPGDYNVHCIHCGQVWQPNEGSSFWWQAKKHAEAGKLDALPVTGQECGCIPTPREPNAPFRVFGYDMMQAFDAPFYTFTEAVTVFRKLKGSVDDVFISGVSPKVEERLLWA